VIIKSVISLIDLFKSVSDVEEIGTSSTTGTRGVNRAYKITLDDDKSFIWKPQFGEHVSSWRFVPPKTLYKREVAAYLVNNQLGFGIVPKTKIVKFKNKIGSLQEWVENTTQSDTTLKSYSDEDIWKMGLFDLIIGQNDRHSGNWIDKDDKPTAIDNGFSFPDFAEKDNDRSLILSRFSYSIWDKPIPRTYLERLRRLKSSDFQNDLSKYIDNKSISLMNERVDYMINTGKASFSKYKVIEKLLKAPE